MSQRPEDPRGDEPELLSPELEDELAAVLRAAWEPAKLDPVLNEALIDATLEDPLAEPGEEEIAESARLRRALEGEGDHPDAALAHALALAHAPRDLPGKRHRDLTRRALVRRSNVLYVVFGATATLAAIAAAAMLFLFPASRSAAPTERPIERLAVSRSTTPMFDKKFATADTTARVDRITTARERDLRQNLYAVWGVR